MSGAHTSGPWTVRDQPWASGGSKHWIDGPNGSALATTVSKQTSNPRVKAGVEANARLIAAAPELLEALEAFAGYPDVREFVGALCHDKALNALAKARGEA